MCGICGVVRFDGLPIDGSIHEACRLLHHRGPDHTGVWSFQGNHFSISLGAARLAVLDPRAKADQPLHRDGRFHLAYNGELYNFRQLRNELTALGERFVTDGDTEVVLAACARWGLDALPRFDGMFAFAFFDSSRQLGFLARDAMGIKPLVYAVSGQELVFSSEVRALTRLGSWRKDVDAGTVVQHLVFGYIDAPATIYRAAWRLQPGHVLAFGSSGINEPRDYRAASRVDNSSLVETDYVRARSSIRRYIGDAVARQRVSDVPVGAFLSGGLDSSIVVSHLAETTPGPVHTFCVGYAEAKSYDERRYARLVAARFGTRHEEVVLTENDVLAAIPRILDHLGEPVGDSSIVPTSLVSWVARQFVTVALSGDGGDELFGGYWRYLAHQSLASYARLPKVVRKAILEPLLTTMALSRSNSLGNRIRQFRKLLRGSGRTALERHLAWSRILPDEARPLFCDAAVVDRCVNSMFERGSEMSPGRAQGKEAKGAMGFGHHQLAPVNDEIGLNGILAFDLSHQLPSDMLHKVDLASMLHSLEVRVPLLDTAVIQAAGRMPASFKMYRGQRKRILIDAYRGHLPDEILDRTKQGFEVPIGELLRGPLRDLFHDTVRSETVDSFGILFYPAIARLYEDHTDRRADYADLLWALLSLCWWRNGNRAQ